MTHRQGQREEEDRHSAEEPMTAVPARGTPHLPAEAPEDLAGCFPTQGHQQVLLDKNSHPKPGGPLSTPLTKSRWITSPAPPKPCPRHPRGLWAHCVMGQGGGDGPSWCQRHWDALAIQMVPTAMKPTESLSLCYHQGSTIPNAEVIKYSSPKNSSVGKNANNCCG